MRKLIFKKIEEKKEYLKTIMAANCFLFSIFILNSVLSFKLLFIKTEFIPANDFSKVIFTLNKSYFLIIITYLISLFLLLLLKKAYKIVYGHENRDLTELGELEIGPAIRTKVMVGKK